MIENEVYAKISFSLTDNSGGFFLYLVPGTVLTHLVPASKNVVPKKSKRIRLAKKVPPMDARFSQSYLLSIYPLAPPASLLWLIPSLVPTASRLTNFIGIVNRF